MLGEYSPTQLYPKVASGCGQRGKKRSWLVKDLSLTPRMDVCKNKTKTTVVVGTTTKTLSVVGLGRWRWQSPW